MYSLRYFYRLGMNQRLVRPEGTWEKDEGRKSRQSDALILITLLRGRMTIPLREWFALSITKRSVDHGAKTDQ